MPDDELESMLAEIGGECSYDNMIKCFESKLSGGNANDSDNVIIEAIKCFDEEGIYIL